VTTSDETAPIKLEKWQHARTARDVAYIVQEGKKAGITPAALEKLNRALSRQEKGTATRGEASRVKKDIHELRVDIDGRWYRVLFSRKGDKFVTLKLIVKKSNKLDNNDIQSAVTRLAAHAWT
jgi:phage-related protein